MAKKDKTCTLLSLVIALIICCIGLLIALVVLTVVKDRELARIGKQTSCDSPRKSVNLTERKQPSVFRDLTNDEIMAISTYLKTDNSVNLKLGKPSKNSSFIYLIELLLPAKNHVMAYLDNNGPKPERWAKVVLFRGELNPQIVETYKVGPLPVPNSHTIIGNAVKYAYRPYTDTEIEDWDNILQKLQNELETLLLESYGTKFFDCEPAKCLRYFPSPISSAHFGKPKRYHGMMFYHDVEYYTLYPVDLQIIVEYDEDLLENIVVEIFYNNNIYNSSNSLMRSYNLPGFKKVKFLFPKNESDQEYSKLKINTTVKKPLRHPVYFVPDGERYTIRDRQIAYMNWSFELRMATSNGPALYDIRYKGSRLMYELSLQEIAVYYSSFTPSYKTANYFDSFLMLGTLAKPLIPGVDCPVQATFIPTLHFTDGADRPKISSNAFCVFEHNTEMPIHRHMDPEFYGGMLDTVLVLRTIIVVDNYDYIFNFIFHQSGALEVKVFSTGYTLAVYYIPEEDPYGWNLVKNVLSPIHQHCFHFKVDIDIHGVSNSFEKLNIKQRFVDNRWVSKSANDTPELYFEAETVTTEEQARYHYDFNKPTYLLFQNRDIKTSHGVKRSYRLHVPGIAKWLYPPNTGSEKSASWARQQVAVTRYKENETRSSSIFASYDGYEPTVVFDNFIDNETIVDEDLVAWITLGTHHIPHTEDLPITPTSASGLSFVWLPYNYFPVCPSMQSPDGVYIKKTGSTLRVQDTGLNRSSTICKTQPTDFVKIIKEKKSDWFP